jgi:hypothetical protein
MGAPFSVVTKKLLHKRLSQPEKYDERGNGDHNSEKKPCYPI